MNRYFSLFTLILVIGASPLIAQANVDTFLDQATSVKNFIDQASQFGADKLGKNQDAYKAQLKNAVKDELEKLVPDPTTEDPNHKVTKEEYLLRQANLDKLALDSDTYFTNLRTAWNGIMPEFGDNTALKNQYVAQGEDTHINAVLRTDMMGEGILENGQFDKYTGALSAADYQSTFESLNSAYRWNLAHPNTSPKPPVGSKTFEPSTSLDKPVPLAWWARRFSLTNEGTIWENNSVYSILSMLNNMQQLSMSGAWYWNQGWTGGDWSSFQSDLGYFLNKTGAAGQEGYQMTLSQGSTAYVDEYGKSFTPNPDQYYADLDVQSTYSLSFYMGRNTAVANSTGASVGGYTTSQNEQQGTVVMDGCAYKVCAWETRTPIVLDMNGDQKLEASGGEWAVHSLPKNAKLVPFDINGDGFDELVEWVGANDGLLLNYTGQAVNGNNLFGDAGGFADGYEKLSLLDENGDKQLTGKELATLSVWQDRNGNAKVDKGEVTSVAELGITSISIAPTNFVAPFVQNGKTQIMWDWHPVSIIVKKTK